MAGLELDPWQELVIEGALGERADGQWSAFEVGVEVPRQNGKGSLLEARELAGLFILGERLIIHSAHEFATAIEAFERMLMLLESCPDLDRRVQRVSRAHGSEGILLKGGQRLRYRTRTKGGGRGFSCDCLILDEAMYIPEAMHAALFPTLAARPNPQIWYTGSAVDQMTMDNGVVFARVRERGVAATDPRLAYFSWSLPFSDPGEVTVADAQDPENWALANPGMGIRIAEEYVAAEQRSLDARGFAVERLGVGDWPATDGSDRRVIDPEVWRSYADESSTILDPVCLAFDVAPDRSSSSIAAAGFRADKLSGVEIVQTGSGTGWVVDRLQELARSHRPIAIVADGAGPAASLLDELARRKVKVTWVSAKEHAQACGVFFDAVSQGTLRHLGTDELRLAVDGAAKRPLGDAWAWSRRSSSVDISPLVASTLALWGTRTRRRRPQAFSLSDALNGASL